MRRRGARFWLAGVAGRLVLGALFRTVRFESSGEEHFRPLVEAGRPFIFVLWHGRLLPLAYRHRGEGHVGLVSRSEDGEYIARVLEGWGFGTVRGSSSRGGSAALRELVRHLRAGRTLALTPDGPRGPRQRMKLGALVAAQLANVPLVPVAAGARRAWWFEGWDRFLVPKPFARVRIAYGPPHEVPRTADPEELQERALRLEAELNRLLDEVDRDAGTR